MKNGDFILYQIKMDYENRIPEIMRKGKTKNEVLTFLKGYMDIVSKNKALKLCGWVWQKPYFFVRGQSVGF